MPDPYAIQPPSEEPPEDLDGPTETTEAAPNEEQPPEREGQPVVTAFIVLIHEDGNATFETDFDKVFSAEREATHDDVLRATHFVHEDLVIGKTAAATIAQQMVVAQQMQQAAEHQRILQETGLVNAKGGHLAKGGQPRRKR